jgi:hypothetical protein
MRSTSAQLRARPPFPRRHAAPGSPPGALQHSATTLERRSTERPGALRAVLSRQASLPADWKVEGELTLLPAACCVSQLPAKPAATDTQQSHSFASHAPPKPTEAPADGEPPSPLTPLGASGLSASLPTVASPPSAPGSLSARLDAQRTQQARRDARLAVKYSWCV